jgi:hypothetical protein
VLLWHTVTLLLATDDTIGQAILGLGIGAASFLAGFLASFALGGRF